MMVLSGHGRGDDIKTMDGQYVKIQDLVNLIDNQHCALLAGKPKIIFVNSCRGCEYYKL